MIEQDSLGGEHSFELGQTLTVQEVQIALSFLKKRFSQYSIQQIVLSLTQHVQKNPPTNPVHRQDQYYSRNGRNTERRIDNRSRRGGSGIGSYKSRHTHPTRDQRELRQKINSICQSNEERLNKFEEIRMVAKFFCQTGTNYSLVRYFFPNMSQQQYRCYIETINNQTLNEIQKFLRYQCNIQIEHLAYDQKRTLKTQLVKVRQWLGKKSISQLQTYYKFMERHYQQKKVQITYDEALKLYKTLLMVIKSPYVDVMDLPARRNNKEYNSEDSDEELITTFQPTITKEDQKNVVQYYLKHKSLDKMTSKFNQLYGYSSKWNKPQARKIVKNAIRHALKKIILSKDRYLPPNYSINFDHTEDHSSKLFENDRSDSLKSNLLTFYLANRITISGLTTLLKQLNQFYANQNNDDSILPKLEVEDKYEIVSISSQQQHVQFEQQQQEHQGSLIQKQSELERQLENIEEVQTEPKLELLFSDDSAKEEGLSNRQTAPANYDQIIELV